MAKASTVCHVAERKRAGTDQHAGSLAEAKTPGQLDREHLPQQCFEERSKDDSDEENPPCTHVREMGCGRSAAHAFGDQPKYQQHGHGQDEGANYTSAEAYDHGTKNWALKAPLAPRYGTINPVF
jgi:hypothetical protein